MKFPALSRSLGVLAASLVLTALLVPTGRAALGTPRAQAFQPLPQGNGLAAFSSNRTGDNEIFTMDFVDGTDQMNITNSPGSDSQPAWSPDGNKIAFTSDRDGNNNVYVMRSDGTEIRRLTGSPRSDSQPSWSPDGTQIAFTSNLSGNDEIYVMTASDGSNKVNLTNNPAPDSQPSWSPEGTEIAFTSRRDGNNEIYVMDAPTGAGQANLTNSVTSDSQPTWSPGGGKIAFTSSRSGNSDIWEMNAGGGGLRNLTNAPGADSTPLYSPDQGSRLLFTSRRDGNNEIYILNVFDGSYQTNLTHDAAADTMPAWQPLPGGQPSGSPIEHVVILFMENHSFNELFGRLCVEQSRCEGTLTGETFEGDTIPLRPGTDHVPVVGHSRENQVLAINGGAMNGWSIMNGCHVFTDYRCYRVYDQPQIPNLWNLAETFTIADQTFQMDSVPTWGAHLELASMTLNGFTRGDTIEGQGGFGPGRGCDSQRDSEWQATPFDEPGMVPACIPKQDRTGPYRESPVPWVPTIMGRMDSAGRSWRLYAPLVTESRSSYGYSICPTFAECIYGPQGANHVHRDEFLTDAAAGTLPALSILIPTEEQSQHNNFSMIEGDNWIGTRLDAAMNGPDWNSTAVFITYDDCGCFYDQVPPPEGLGIRTPMVIVSPWAKPGYTDSNVASYASMMAFVEHTFGLAPLSVRDNEAYDFRSSFDFTQQPLGPIQMQQNPIPAETIRWMKNNPPPPDDPT